MPTRKSSPRSRKKTAEVEILPPDDELIEESNEELETDDDPIVEQEHIVKNRYVTRKPLSEINEVEVESEDDDYAPAKPKKKTLRQKYKDSVDKGRINPGDQLMMRVDRLPQYSSDGTIGVQADREFCFRMPVTLEFLEREDYLPLLQQRGPGAYQLTIRDGKGVIDMIDVHISKAQANVLHAAPQTVVDPATGAQTIIYQQAPNGNAPVQPVSVIDPMKQFRDSLKMMKEVREAFGVDVTPQQAQSAAVFDANAINAEVMKSRAFAEGIAGILNPDKGRSGKRDIMELMFENAPAIIRELKDAVREIVGDIKQGQHEQAQMVQSSDSQTRQNQIAAPHGNGETLSSQSSQGQTQSGASAQGANAVTQAQLIEINDPSDEFLNFLIASCVANAPIPATRAGIRYREGKIENLEKVVENYINYEVDDLHEMCALLYPPIKDVPHAKEWLQALIDSYPAAN